jgi:carbamoyltransferase
LRVLGLNGWPGRGHDPAACLVVDGEIVAVAEEERFVRRKHAYGLPPHHAAAFCLSRAGLDLDEVDVVAFGWDIPKLHRDRGLPWQLDAAGALESLLPRELFPRKRDPEFVFVPHHIAHAASAYHVSGHENASVLVLDGQGELESASLMVGRSGRLETLSTVPISWSLGYFYDAVGQYIGLGPDQAGKLMGLAAHGVVRDDTFGSFTFTESGYELRGMPADMRSRTEMDESGDATRAWLRHLEATCSLPPNPRRRRYDPATGRYQPWTERDPFEYRDLAAAAQQALERAVFGLTDALVRETGESTLHVSGGVGFNASLNGKLLDHPAVDELFVQPLAGDAGVAIGAAVHIAAQRGDSVRPITTSIGWGVDFDPATVRGLLDETGLSYEEPSDIAAATAKLVAQDGVVGWFQGRGEVGPRALGHRSIVADPARRATRDRINLEIKKREWWRPLAPSLAAECFDEHIDSPASLPYMIVTRPLREASRARLAAVDHVDGSTRPQAVHAADEPLYHQLLDRVGEETGAAVTVNTSFNDNEEPVVWTPADAVRTFARIGLDALAIGPFLVSKR